MIETGSLWIFKNGKHSEFFRKCTLAKAHQQDWRKVQQFQDQHQFRTRACLSQAQVFEAATAQVLELKAKHGTNRDPGPIFLQYNDKAAVND